jgi:hypothetical protein
MRANSNGHTLSRATILLLAGLMVVSTILFLVGVSLERSAAANRDTHAAVPQAAPTAVSAAEAPEGSQEREAQERQQAAAAASQESAEGMEAHEQAEQNGAFGVDLESPAVLAGVVLGTLLLIAGLFVFGARVLPLVVLVALAAAAFDVREVVFQLGQAHFAIAALVVGIVISRLATALIAWRGWRAGRQQGHPSVTA